MTNSTDKIDQIFWEALQLTSEEERKSYLDRACGADEVLHGLVEKLLRAQPKVAEFLEQPLADAHATRDEPITERPGTVIGPYKLMEQIGEGGMGLVFVAEQQHPVRRKVALKVIKPGMDTRAVVARFEAERQALALMDHPNIAKVHDGGETGSARPYFVMELVKGVPITEYCDQNQVPVRERLELFLHVCHAVQHAHQKGIIHRDIKPSNVLIMSQDGTPLVKVIDFGVAKAIGQQLTEKTIYTQFTQLVGTPLYMSPEQAGQSGVDVDTRSDIYSLGVLLYELLTGTTPVYKERLKEAGYDEIRRIIREEEPPKPSTRISTLGQAATTVSTQRKSDPKRLSQLFRGELDWIVMKALEKDRTRRYETANGLAMDVKRYLHDEPVLACPPSAGYRLRKFARKYRALLRIAGAFVVFLVLAAAVSTWQAVRASLAGQRALAERDRAEASFRMARDAVDQLFTQVSQSPKLKTQSMEKFRKDLLQNAKGFYERFIREQFDAPGVRYDLGLAHQRLAEIQRELGDYAAAEETLTKAIAVLDELVRAQPAMAEYQRDLAASYSALGLVYFDTAHWEKADAANQRTLAIQAKLVAANPGAPEYRYSLAKTYSALGLVHIRWDTESAASNCQQAQNILSKLVQQYPKESEYKSLLAATQMNLGQVYLPRGWYDEAEMALKDAVSIYAELVRGQPDGLPEHYQSLARSRALLGWSYCDANQTAKAEEEEQQALRIFEKLAQEHPDVVEYAYDVGRCHIELGRTAVRGGRPQSALEEYAKAIEIMERAMDKGYLRARTTLLNARTGRARALAERGDHAQATEEAEALARQGDFSVHLYNVACVFSRSSAATDHDVKLSPADRNRVKARYADRAMDFLRQAVAKGWRHPSLIKKDRDFEPVRAREDFQKLLADLEAKSTNK
jgi:serine/threonine protein kinase/tetratricopeptide (TPR) repeat protein